MLWKKTKQFWKIGFSTISTVLMLSISGCSDASPEEIKIDEIITEVQPITESIEQNFPENPKEDDEKITNICLELYQKAATEYKLSDLEAIRSIVNQFGQNGYPAVDSKNQIDMTRAEQVMQFCKKVDTQETAEITIIEVNDIGGFTKYDLQTKEGKVDVVTSYYQYENGMIKREVTGNFQAEYWNYTREGYLMFSGVWFAQDMYVLTLSGAEEHVAFRVEPLEETYRELNRRYLLPVGYAQNDMFLMDWSEDDFSTLNFYDLYDIFYQLKNGKNVPYVADENLGVGAVYQIPKDEFESVIMTYLKIDSKTLQSKTNYNEENGTYEYKPRGFYDAEYPEHPYPEVVGYTENSDGTITLTVNVVFPHAGNSKVYAHEVIVRPLEDGGVQYVSNHIIPSEENQEVTWHIKRLTTQEWEKMYGEVQSD